MSTTTKRQQAQRIAELSASKAKYEAERDQLIALWDAGSIDIAATDINRLHDVIYELDQDIRLAEIGPVADKGDWNDRTSRWHY